MTARARCRFGVLGAANIATKRFVPAVRDSRNAEIVAIASRDGARAREVATRFAIPRSYDSYEALLADPEIDAIYNPLPNALHAEWTLAAARAGKAILCEKPLATSPDEARRVVDGCRDAGVLVMEAFMYRFHPQHARVRDLVPGTIGEVRAMRAAFSFSLEPFDANNVRLNAALGGGALADVGCYPIDAARTIFGEEPLWAAAFADVDPRFGVDVTVAGMLGFGGNRVATIDCGFRAAGRGWYHVSGSAGSVFVLNAFTPQPDEGDVTIVVDDGRERRFERVPAVDQYRLEAEAFADAVLHATPLATPAEDAVANARVIAALRRSAAHDGRRESIA